MKKNLALFIILSVFFMMSGCNNDNDKLTGIWMHVEESLPGTVHYKRYYTIIEFTKDAQLNVLSGKKVGIVYENVSGQINIIDAATKKTILVATDIASDMVILKNLEMGGESQRYERITRDKAMEIKARIDAAR